MRAFFFLLISVLVNVIACANLTLYRNDQASSSTNVKEFSQSTFLWGYVPRPKLLESQLCPGSRLDVLKFNMTSGDVWLTVATLGIYVPSRVEVHCAK